MSMTVEELFELALKLAPEDRVKLAERLYESALSPEWRAEIERRLDDAIAHPEKGIPLEEAMVDIRRQLDEHRKNKRRDRTPPS